MVDKADNDMTNIEAIHDFAAEYYRLYSDLRTDPSQVINDFEDQCRELGFDNEAAVERLRQKYSDDVMHNPDTLRRVVDDENDPMLLGTAIFVNWDRITGSTDGSSEDLFIDFNRVWFLLAFVKLMTMTDAHKDDTADENVDRVNRIEVDYDRTTLIGEGSGEVTWEYHERLTIDRATDTITHYRQIFAECDVTHTYHIAEGVSNFLDGLDPGMFSHVTGNPPNVITDPRTTNHYAITIITAQGEHRQIAGTFDKNGLPDDWADFVSELTHFLSFYGMGDLLDERVYGKPLRRTDDLIFCTVTFRPGGREYTYLADSDDYDEGDFVVVPVGRDNHESVARIESVEYHTPAERSADHLKHVARKLDRRKDAHLLD